MKKMLPLVLLPLLALPLSVQAAPVLLNRVAVVVDEESILASEVEARMADVRFQLEQRKTPLPPEDTLRSQVIERMVVDAIQKQMAERAGIKIDDNALNTSMTDLARQNRMTLDDFRKKLEEPGSGTSYEDVRNQVRQDMMISKLRNRRISDRIRISDADVQAFLKSPQGQELLATEYRLGHILISIPENAGPADLQAAQQKTEDIYRQIKAGANFQQLAAANSQAETALQGGDLGWRKAAQLPTLFADQVEKLAAGDVAAPIRTPGGFHIVKVLEKRGAETHIVHQRHVRHILIKPSEITSLEEAREKALALRKRLEAGADFAEQAKLYSEDPGSARNGGDLGWVGPGEMVPEFDKMMSTVAEKTISEVFQTNFGWHILQVLGSRDQDLSDEYRQNMARNALFSRQYDQELQAWLREIRAEAYVEIKKQD